MPISLTDAQATIDYLKSQTSKLAAHLFGQHMTKNQALNAAKAAGPGATKGYFKKVSVKEIDLKTYKNEGWEHKTHKIQGLKVSKPKANHFNGVTAEEHLTLNQQDFTQLLVKCLNFNGQYYQSNDN